MNPSKGNPFTPPPAAQQWRVEIWLGPDGERVLGQAFVTEFTATAFHKKMDRGLVKIVEQTCCEMLIIRRPLP